MTGLASVRAKFRAYVAGWHRSRYLNQPVFKELESRVVWVFGSPRTGSTWLLRMLAEARAPGVATINETWAGELFNRGFAWHQDGTLKITSSAASKASLPGWVFGPEREPLWRPQMRAVLLESFEHQLVHGQAKTDWPHPHVVVKEPNTSEAADYLVKLLPRSRVLFLIRDGRDVVDSMLDLFTTAAWGPPQELGWDGLPRDERHNFLLGNAANWVYRMDVVERACDLVGPGAALRVRYEDLFASTADELIRIADWLGVEASGDWAAEVARRHAFERIPEEERGSGKFHRAATPGLWRQNMGADEQKLLHEVMGDKLRELGYDAD